jgi:type IV pilus assembly protein PilE
MFARLDRAGVQGLLVMKRRGFSLIELIVVLAIAALLAALAYPAFADQLRKARRSDALASMVQIETAQARFRSSNSRYGSLSEIGSANLSPAGHYALNASNHTADGYEALATALGGQALDMRCRYLKLVVVRANSVYSSGNDLSLGNSIAENRKCWQL